MWQTYLSLTISSVSCSVPLLLLHITLWWTWYHNMHLSYVYVIVLSMHLTCCMRNRLLIVSANVLCVTHTHTQNIGRHNQLCLCVCVCFLFSFVYLAAFSANKNVYKYLQSKYISVHGQSQNVTRTLRSAAFLKKKTNTYTVYLSICLTNFMKFLHSDTFSAFVSYIYEPLKYSNFYKSEMPYPPF